MYANRRSNYILNMFFNYSNLYKMCSSENFFLNYTKSKLNLKKSNNTSNNVLVFFYPNCKKLFIFERRNFK